jgi:translation initiation factor IF-3
MNWGIAPGDLNMKIAKICAFLEEGRKVDVMIASKKRRRKASAEEMAELLAKLEEGVAKVEGAHQGTPPEGKMGETMTFYFEKRGGS